MHSKDRSVMKIVSIPAFFLAAIAGALSLLAISIGTAVASEPKSPSAPPDIVDTAVAAGDFNTLVAALKAAGLVETLKGAGPYTVFAPNDAAFAKIPQEQLNALLADKKKLTAVLTYHVVPAKAMAAAVKSGPVKTVQGQSLQVEASAAGVKVNNAEVIQADIVASNGVIHVIDTVLIPQ